MEQKISTGEAIPLRANRSIQTEGMLAVVKEDIISDALGCGAAGMYLLNGI